MELHHPPLGHSRLLQQTITSCPHRLPLDCGRMMELLYPSAHHYKGQLSVESHKRLSWPPSSISAQCSVGTCFLSPRLHHCELFRPITHCIHTTKYECINLHSKPLCTGDQVNTQIIKCNLHLTSPANSSVASRCKNLFSVISTWLFS